MMAINAARNIVYNMRQRLGCCCYVVSQVMASLL